MNLNSLKCNKRDSSYDYMAKLIIIGDSGVGKTNILTRFCQETFKQTHVATIGVDFNVRTILIDDKKLKMQVWDTAGQQRFKTITQTYYKGARGIILVYAVDSKDSFENIEKWIEQVSEKTSPSVKKILVANKVDCSPQLREVSRQEGQLIADKFGLEFMQVSAKENKRVYDIFYKLGRQIKQNFEFESREIENYSRKIIINGVNQKDFVKNKKQKVLCNNC